MSNVIKKNKKNMKLKSTFRKKKKNLRKTRIKKLSTKSHKKKRGKKISNLKGGKEPLPPKLHLEKNHYHQSYISLFI